jgi:hypothetical protein
VSIYGVGIGQAQDNTNAPQSPVNSAIDGAKRELESLHQSLAMLHGALESVLRSVPPQENKSAAREVGSSQLHEDVITLRESIALANELVSSIRARLTV